MGQVRRPSFLAAVAPDLDARPASFTVTPGHGRPAFRPPARRPEQPQLEAAALAQVRADAMEKVRHGVEMLRLLSERLAEQARADALEIGFQVARRVIDAELQSSPEALFGLVRSALKRAGDSRKITIRLHPEDARVVGATIASGDLTVASAGVEVFADATLARGDCVVDTDFGKVDGTLRTRLEELRRAASAAIEEGAA
jgi:flagellar assembly protein FliH